MTRRAPSTTAERRAFVSRKEEPVGLAWTRTAHLGAPSRRAMAAVERRAARRSRGQCSSRWTRTIRGMRRARRILVRRFAALSLCSSAVSD